MDPMNPLVSIGFNQWEATSGDLRAEYLFHASGYKPVTEGARKKQGLQGLGDKHAAG